MSRFIITLILVLGAIQQAARGDGQPAIWLYYPTNLAVEKNVQTLEQIWRRAAAVGYSHVLLSDSKFCRIGELGGIEKRYDANLQRVKKLAAELKLQIVPAVFPIGYSNDLLFEEPNLAEGLPVGDQLFVVHDGAAKLQAEPVVSLGRWSFKDADVLVAGGVATVRENEGNARLRWTLKVSPFRCYHVWVWIKSDHFTGQPEIKALADGQSLQYQNVRFEPTQDWTKCDVVFNSLDHGSVNLYLGVWGAARGTLQWKDWGIEEAGLVNVLRRTGTPLVVKNDADGTVYQEGKDFEPVHDGVMEKNHGNYDAWHEGPVIRTKLAEGTRLRVSWYHPAIIYQEQMAMCANEPAARRLLEDEFGRVSGAWGAAGYMMGFDEIRVMGWDESCAATHEDAGAMLADEARFCTGLLKGSKAYTWSDVFDPYHNAKDHYYLVKGDLAGSWKGLSPGVVVVNWNFEHRDESLKFFADQGHEQIIAGYYDGDVDRVRDWMESAKKVRGVIGVMYTTWEHKYDDLEAFARDVRE